MSTSCKILFSKFEPLRQVANDLLVLATELQQVFDAVMTLGSRTLSCERTPRAGNPCVFADHFPVGNEVIH